MEKVSKEQIQEALIERHGEEIQKKLDQASVAIAGLGGLGSNIAYFLARTGIKKLHLIDFDVVDLTNLNRQQYGIRHLGMKKTEALKEQLLEINPYMEIKTHFGKVTEENLLELLKDEDIICEAFDQPEAKAMLVNGVLEHFPDKMLAAASGMAGYGNSNAIQTKKVFGNFYLCGDGVTDIADGMGLMAPRVAICAAHQANIIVEYIINQ